MANTCGNKVLEPQAGEDCDGEPGCHDPQDAFACRWRCSRLPDAASVQQDCPAGFACGLDGVCRRPNGSYSLVSAELAPPSLGLALGDLDADGRRDLVRTSVDTTFVHFYDADANISTLDIVARAPEQSLLGDLTGDGRDDFAFRSQIGRDFGAGLAVLRSQPDRSFASTIYSALPKLPASHVKGMTTNALAPFNEDELVVFLQGLPFCSEPTTISGVPDEFNAEVIGCSDLSVDDLVGLTAADFDADPVNSPCPEVAYAGAGQSDALLLSPCEVSGSDIGWNYTGVAAQRRVSLPVGNNIFGFPEGGPQPRDAAQALFAAHLNGDANLDLVMVSAASSLPSTAGLHVAYGQGDGSFHSSPSPPPFVGDDQATVLKLDYDTTLCAQPLGIPLVFADFDGDGWSDVVGQNLILRRTFYTDHDYQVVGCGGPWRRAVVADFDGNSTLDVVAARSNDNALDFFAGAGDGTFSRSVIASKEPGTELTSGDFDGDQLTDFMYVQLASRPTEAERAEGAVQGPDRIFVSFGRPFATPELPVEIGEISGVKQVLVGRHEGGDSTSDILILTVDPFFGFGLSVVPGDGDRELRAPFLFPVTKDDDPVVTSMDWVAIGRFGADPAERGLVAVTRDDPAMGGSYRFWRVHSVGEAQLSATRASESEGETSLDCAGCWLAVVDLDGDDIDEVVSFQTDKISTYAVVDGEIRFAAAIPTEHRFVDPLTQSHLRRPVVRDLDGDGLAEVLLRNADGDVLLFWNDGSGSLSTDPTGLTVVASATNKGAVTLDFALLQADTDPEPELAVLNQSDGVKLLQIDVAARSVQELANAPLLTTLDSVQKLGGELIVGGDLDGDGIDDLVIAGFDGYTVLRGMAVRP